MSNSPQPPRQPMASRVRRASYSKTSSASCSNAKPNEDWTKMTDLVMRRRVQNRIAQRNYRASTKKSLAFPTSSPPDTGEKKRQQRTEDQETRSSSTSASPGNVTPATYHSSPESCRASLSAAPAAGSDLLPHQQPPVFQHTYAQQYITGHENRYPVATESYLRESMTAAPVSYSYPSYTATVPAPYAAFSHPQSYASFPAGHLSYADPGSQHPAPVPSSSLRSSIGFPVTPITPTSQGDCYPVNHRPQYDLGYEQDYEDFRVPTTHAPADSATSVNNSDFFRRNYPSS